MALKTWLCVAFIFKLLFKELTRQNINKKRKFFAMKHLVKKDNNALC